MGSGWCRAAVFAALCVPSGAGAQDVTLSAREGGLEISGTLQGYDGEFYRVDSVYGLLTVDAAGVICDGPACPDLTAPKARVRIVGLAGVGETLLPPLMRAFAEARGLSYDEDMQGGYSAVVSDPQSGKPLADIGFVGATPELARAELLAGRAEMVLAAATEPAMGSRVLALDAMVPIVAPDNPVPKISTRDLARVLAGEVANWSDIGGPDMPLVLHGLAPDEALQRALAARLGRDVAASVVHGDIAALGDAVQRDPWAVAMTVRAGVRDARALPLTDSCGFPLLPSALAVKAEDYPLSLPMYLLTPNRRLPLFVREFLTFLDTPQAQAVVAAAGWIDRQPERQPLTGDGLRLINAIQGAGEETTLADLKRLADAMNGADRLSLTFRFQDGSSQLDAHSRDNLEDLAQLIEVGVFRDQALVLAGFSDGSGAAAANLALSQSRAEGVLAGLAKAGVAEADLPKIIAFGEAMPMACDETGAGRRLNRRVEVWLKPVFKDTRPSGN
ncbi:MAG: phosphate ABC transporter substrate-binding/OmpA family protein [Pseudotabrizicola sp.]|uniref:phosphate ABC transporter substrate-binding/OmpA family protein n=1 Tax=Pseudotabrizicola sp. TaxID=2939647 RepID=UPI002730CC91|nr:phosphate ABC transporter substrate-binding/OmpA family protein [Pseudotabrizicola sp.]MDP2083336.1 phosphate ABC transporter substrate-binding/OmpA family protein [Pseudotabrizicola sp.]MDZ7574874.1 phosphate ABC transporter substrate-binding/OmpA family protein [Pseudotabrizicola sp.]